MKRFPAALVGALSLAGTQVHAGDITDTVHKAIVYNPDVLVTQEDRNAIEQNVREAKAGYLPRVDVYAGVGGEKSDNASTLGETGKNGYRGLHREESGISITQMLFDGFFTKNEVARQKATLQAASYRVLAAGEDVGLRATQTYLDVLRRREQVEVAKDNLAAHQRIYDQIRMRSERGVGRTADTDQAAGRLALAKANLEAVMGNLRDAEIAYVRVVGEMPTDLVPPTPPADRIPADLPALVDEARQTHPVLASAVADIDATMAQHEQARANDYPRFDLELGASHNNNIDGVNQADEDLIAMVRMNYNIYRGGADLARKRSTAFKINQAKRIRDRAEDQVIQEAGLSWNDYQTAQTRLELLRQHADSANVTRAAYLKQFNIGQRTLLDLLDTENERFVAESNYIDGKYRVMYAIYRIVASEGRLLSTLGVTPPEGSEVTTGK
ncbi:TolC family outer membrane protein [Immundisolibacter sp.]|uniref:TolC family outer membrane protein n=1 Tax=Immundisolibacter sp. TaxID=1934948 RepID=UPI002623EEDB|nr:TolC family outer membrane protein [Immundisolibacter sp.]MDD3652518.1 TolC family outer membrane protein [Immundisolibacter sp.]